MDNTYKPLYHFSASNGWLNDPNGLVRFKGEYHMFYQYHPDTLEDRGAVGACWGHAVSKDLLRWKDLPIALMPSEPYDKDGCWSGTAIVKDDTLYIIYTGYAETPAGVRQTQCLAYSKDGINFEKYPENPVIGSSSIPKHSSKIDFRDPEAFKFGDEWHIFIGSHTDYGCPQLLVYTTKDLIHYEYGGFAEKRTESGTMWECPNVISFGGDKVGLIVSPQWYPSDGDRFTNVSSTVYSIGRYKVDKREYHGSVFREVDTGCDFYATRCMQLDERTPVMLSWLQMWGRRMLPLELGHGWSGIIGLPRTLFLDRDGKLIQTPLHGIYNRFKNRVKENVRFKGERRFDKMRGRCMYLRVSMSAATEDTTMAELRVLEGDGNYASIFFNFKESSITFDKSHVLYPLGGHPDECESSRNGVRTVKLKHAFKVNRKRFQVEVFIDKCTVEVFIDNGVATMSNLVFNSPTADGVVALTDGEVNADLMKYDIVFDD